MGEIIDIPRLGNSGLSFPIAMMPGDDWERF